MNGVFVLNYDCDGGKMKCAVKKMMGDEGLVDRLTAISDHCSGMGPKKVKKKIEWWKVENMCQTSGISKFWCVKLVELGNFGVLSDE